MRLSGGLAGAVREKSHALDYIEGLDILASMRLCANVLAQYAIQTALGGYQSINDLVLPTGRLGKQRDVAWQLLTAIPGVSCVKPRAALYLFRALIPGFIPSPMISILCWNCSWKRRCCWCKAVVSTGLSQIICGWCFCLTGDDLTNAIERLARFLDRYRRRHES